MKLTHPWLYLPLFIMVGFILTGLLLTACGGTAPKTYITQALHYPNVI